MLRSFIVFSFTFLSINCYSNNCLKLLVNLNEHLTLKEISTKVKNSDDVYTFFRSFVSYFYYNVTNRPFNQETETLLNTRGLLIGDAHLGNFGVGLNLKGESLFTVNDYDDSNTGSIFLDYLRFLVSYKLYFKNLPKDLLNEFSENYKKGLKGLAYKYSESVDQKISESQVLGKNPKGNYFKGKKLKRKSNSSDLTEDEMFELRSLINEKVTSGHWTFGDAFKYYKDSGGSAPLVRYRFYITLYPNIKKVFELKKVVKSAVSYSKDGVEDNDRLRITKSLQLSFGEYDRNHFKVLDFLKSKYLLRPKWAGGIGVDLKDDFDDLHLISKDIAYQIGLFHRKSLKNEFLEEYINSFESTKNKSLSLLVEETSLGILSFYKKLKK